MSEEYDYPEGGEQRYEGDGPNLRYDDFVERIVKDPKDPPGVTLLSGYLGSSSEEACVRLYLDEELSRYVEIPEKAILHTQELTPEQSPLGGSLVWLDRGAEVAHGAVGTERRWATFLEGQIAQDYMGAAQAGAFAGLSGSTQTRECFTPPSAYGPECGPSKSGPCIPQTEFIGCRTRTGILCTRLGPNCGRTSYDPVCTIAGPNCRTLVFLQCQPSLLSPCITHDIECQASGYVPCNPPVDFTIGQGQFGHPAAHAGTVTGQTGNPCGGQPLPTPTTYACPPPASLHSCRTGMGCHVRRGGEPPFQSTQTQTKECGPTYNCPSEWCHFPTTPQWCPDTRVGACATHAACPSAVDACPTRLCHQGGGFDFAGGQHAGVVATQFCAATPQTQYRECVTRLCPSAVDACPTRFNCPSLNAPCQSHYYRCPTQTDLCQSAYATCPTRAGLLCVSRQYVQCGSTQLYGCITQVGCGTLSQYPTQTPACGIDETGGGF
jgi:hypothetical protein